MAQIKQGAVNIPERFVFMWTDVNLVLRHKSTGSTVGFFLVKESFSFPLLPKRLLIGRCVINGALVIKGTLRWLVLLFGAI